MVVCYKCKTEFKNVPTSSNQEIDVLLEETDGLDEVVLVAKRKNEGK